MAKFSVKSVVNLSKLDLKKASVDANNRLKKSNDSLSSRIKDAEKLAKSKEKELKDFDKQLKAKLKEIDASEKYATKVKADIYSVEKESSKLNEVIKKLKGDESSRSKNVKKLESVKDDLENKIVEYELRSEKAKKLTDDIDSLQIRKQVAQSDLNKILKLQGLTENKIEDLEDSYNKKLKDFHKKEDSIRIEENTLALKLISLQDTVKNKENENNKIIVELEDDIKHKSSELEATNSLVNKAEDEYIAWENKIKKAEGLVEMEKRKVQTVKEAFERWKINTLEQVAKMKLKNKIDKIDKAGLSEILNNG